MKSLLAILFLLSLSTKAESAPIIFICHSGMHYSKLEVVKAYKAMLDEPHLCDNQLLKSEMLNFIGSTESKYKKAWDRNFFRRALIQPTSLSGDKQVIAYVESHSEGIGYVAEFPQGNESIEVCAL